jgi:hypothetical protein
MDTQYRATYKLLEIAGGKHIIGESKQTSKQTKMRVNKNYITQYIRRTIK